MIRRTSELLDSVEPAARGPIEVDEFVVFALLRYRWTLALFLLIGVVFGVAYGVTQASEFVSTAKFFVRFGSREDFAPESAMRSGGTPPANATRIQDEIEILRDPVLHQRLVAKVGADALLRPYDPASRDPDDAALLTKAFHQMQSWWFAPADPDPDAPAPNPAARAMAAAAASGERLSISIQPYSRVITLQYRSHTPAVARDVLHAFMGVCQERHREVFSTAIQRSFIESQYNDALRRHTATVGEFEAHVEECGISDIAAERRRLESLIDGLRTSVAESTIQLKGIAEAIAVLDEMSDGAAFVVANPEHTRLAEELAGLQLAMAELRRTFRPDSDIYRTKSAQYETRIRTLTKELGGAAASPTSAADDPASRNAFLENVRSRRVALELEKSQVEQALGVRRAMLAEREAELDHVIGCEPVHEAFAERVERTKEYVDHLVRVQRDAEILGQMEQDDQLSSLTVIQEPTLPSLNVGPNRWHALLVGIGVGLICGVVLALLRHLRDATYRYPRALERQLGVPVLAVVPDDAQWLEFDDPFIDAGDAFALPVSPVGERGAASPHGEHPAPTATRGER